MCYQDICSQFLPCMEVWGIPRGAQETMLVASKPNLSMPAYVGTLGVDSAPLWRPTITSVGWADRSEGTETHSWYLEHPLSLTLFHIYTHLGHMGESYKAVRSMHHFLTFLQTQRGRTVSHHHVERLLVVHVLLLHWNPRICECLLPSQSEWQNENKKILI